MTNQDQSNGQDDVAVQKVNDADIQMETDEVKPNIVIMAPFFMPPTAEMGKKQVFFKKIKPVWFIWFKPVFIGFY